MDRKSILIIVLCFVVIVLWQFMVARMYPVKPAPAGATNAPPNVVGGTNAPPIPPSMGQAPEAPAVPAPEVFAGTNVPEETLEFTNGNSVYTFSSHGGGLKQVELFPVSRGGRLGTTNRLAVLNDSIPSMATLGIPPGFPPPTLAILDPLGKVQGDGVFRLTPRSGGVQAEKTLTNGLTIIKEFQPESNYLLTATVRLENRSAHPLTLPAQEWYVGTATPADPLDKAAGVLWFNGSKAQEAAGPSSGGGCACQPRVVRISEKEAGSNDVVWAAVHSQFFALALVPAAKTNEPAKTVLIRGIDLPRPSTNYSRAARWVDPNGPPPQGFMTAMIYPPLTLAPGTNVSRQFLIYAGPREFKTLDAISARLNNNLDQVMNFGFFGIVSKVLLLGMNGLHSVLGLGYGWAIVFITIIIKVVFWPLTQASTRSMKRLQALQPQLNAIKEKYKDDPMKMNKKTMEFMREHKVSPLGGCLPMALQMPVFFGFYSMIQSAFELHGARFLWVPDLARPDTQAVIPGLSFIPFFSIAGVGLPINPLPLIMGATMLWQSHLTPPSPGMDPAQQKIMRFMPLIFLGFLYNYSAGLTLYWTVNNLLTILQTKLTRATSQADTAAPAAKAPVLTAPQKKRK